MGAGKSAAPLFCCSISPTSLPPQKRERHAPYRRLEYPLLLLPPGDHQGVLIGSEQDYARIEVKKKLPIPEIEHHIHNALLATQSVPVISKRIRAQRFLHRHLYQLDPRPRLNEMPRTQFQVKFEMKRPNEQFFPQLLSLFTTPQGNFHRALLSPPLTESASIRRYHQVNKKLQLVILQGELIKLVERHHSTTLRIPSTVGIVPIQKCRVETKRLTLPQAYRVLSHPLAAELDRKKKVFWVEHNKTHRIHSIAFDRSQYHHRYLYQVEIQFAGTRGKPSTRPQTMIIADLACLATIIRRAFPQLYFTSRTKSQWAGLDKSK